MHLSRILDQIKRHPSPTEAIDKLGKALEKHEGSLLEKGFQIHCHQVNSRCLCRIDVNL